MRCSAQYKSAALPQHVEHTSVPHASHTMCRVPHPWTTHSSGALVCGPTVRPMHRIHAVGRLRDGTVARHISRTRGHAARALARTRQHVAARVAEWRAASRYVPLSLAPGDAGRRVRRSSSARMISHQSGVMSDDVITRAR
eukprot:7296851-Prymnesium_polylepis.1